MDQGYKTFNRQLSTLNFSTFTANYFYVEKQYFGNYWEYSTDKA